MPTKMIEMVKLPSADVMYAAVDGCDASFDGLFYVAVKTTKIFCKPSCPARTPLRKNVEFFATPQECLFAGYRPCKRCHPMHRTAEVPSYVRLALDLVENAPEERLRDWQIRQVAGDPARLRRYFKQNYGMTFHAYARGRRLGQAFAMIRKGQDVIEATVDSGYESTSGFREAFSKAFGCSPSQITGRETLLMCWLETPLGPVVAAASDSSLFLLEFVDRRMLATQLQVLSKKLNCGFIPGRNGVLDQTARELEEYFAGIRTEFSVPLAYPGTDFQHKVWTHLQTIPYGLTQSYGEMAALIGSPDAQRAVGKANGDNRIAILIPCHRVIKSDGKLCGYGGGLWRKQRLLELESGQFSF